MCCKNYEHFMESQIKMINHHIDKHKWCEHIEDKEKAILDFIKKFSWAFREGYCRNCVSFEMDGVICEAYEESMRIKEV